MRKLVDESVETPKVLEQVNYRVAWLQHQEAARRRQEEAAEKERVNYAQIDWHNFVVVETVDYQQWEVGNFPPPTNPSEVGARVLIQRRQEEGGPPAPSKRDSDSEEETGADTNVQDMEEESSDESESEDEEREAAKKATSTIRAPVMSAPPVQPPPIQAPTPGNVVVRKYDPKAVATVKKREEDQFLVSPITGERIPANKVAEHMKVGLLDPRWVEERDKHITAKATEDVVFAPGQAIEASLKGLAERRTDIFGVGEEAAQETHIGQKMGEEDVMREKMDKVTWDGHSSSAEAAARAARANISLDDQIAQIHRQKGLIPEPETKTVVVVPPQMPQQSQPMMHPVVVGVPVRPAMMVPAPMQQQMQQMQLQQQMQQQHQQQQQQQQQQREQQQRDQQQQQQQQQMQQQQQQQQRQQAQDEPPTKRQRTEDNLIPEGEFMARNLSPVSFKVTVPVMEDKAEWSCSGQTLTLSLHLHDTVASIKTRIHEEVGIKLH